jgi:tetratricopeptide (TPR) repeat protein
MKFYFLFGLSLIYGGPREETLLRSLDPHSISEHLAFYRLYPESPQGIVALEHAWNLLSQGKGKEKLELPKLDIQPIISLITRQSFDQPVKLPEEQLEVIEKFCAHFPNRALKGAHVKSTEEVLSLPNEAIDLGRAILLYQFETLDEVLQYEATLDLIALQIEARLPKNATGEEKICAINRFIFEEMQFRFPPHSLYATDIDLYTFLPSVLDSRQGVCLGVSILYLCLSQRLDLPLEIITPPGHIYVRYRVNGDVINIETTARGINLPSELYLGINTRKLEERTLKEVVGMAFFNQASVFWGKEDYAKTVELYEKAMLYIPDDPLIKMFLGINYLFVGKSQLATQLLTPLKNMTFEYAVSPESIPADFLAGKVDVDGLKAIFKHVDETRHSVIEKQEELKAIIKRFPAFRAGLFQLAVTYLQLGRKNEALEILRKHHQIDPNDVNIEYYLAILSLDRQNIPQAWHYFKRAEALAAARDHYPKSLKGLRQQLKTLSPELAEKTN